MDPVRILCIETALTGCSVCLAEDEKLLAQSVNDIPNSASDQLPGLVADVLRQAGLQFSDLQAVAVSNGPGSYTGLRIGVAAAKGYAYALQIPVIAVSTLLIMAAAARNRLQVTADIYVPAIDARRNEVFWAMYDRNLGVKLTETPMVIGVDTKKMFDENQSYCLLGNGAKKIYDAIGLNEIILLPDLAVGAGDMITLAFTSFWEKQFASTVYLEPNYTKDFHYIPTYIKKN
jgi:tRNA threonylcarbamoyladenosine biosynthesis protein TsaB